MQNRFKSKVVWGSIAAQVLAILVTTGVIETGMSVVLETVIVAVLEMLVAFGILNNPSDSENF